MSEGIHYADGTFVSEAKTSATDGFGHVQLGGLAAMLAAEVIQAATPAPGCAAFEAAAALRRASCLRATDVDLAYNAGRKAVIQAVSGVTGQMVAFEREYIDGKYHCTMVLLPLSSVANYEQLASRRSG